MCIQPRNILRFCYKQETVSLKEVKIENVISVKLAKNEILNAVSCCGEIINYLLEFISLCRVNLNKFLSLSKSNIFCVNINQSLCFLFWHLRPRDLGFKWPVFTSNPAHDTPPHPNPPALTYNFPLTRAIALTLK